MFSRTVSKLQILPIFQFSCKSYSFKIWPRRAILSMLEFQFQLFFILRMGPKWQILKFQFPVSNFQFQSNAFQNGPQWAHFTDISNFNFQFSISNFQFPINEDTMRCV